MDIGRNKKDETTEDAMKTLEEMKRIEAVRKAHPPRYSMNKDDAEVCRIEAELYGWYDENGWHKLEVGK